MAIDESWGLRTVQQGMAYTVCRSLQCDRCALLFSDIRFTSDELYRLYHKYRGTAYTLLREEYEPGYLLRNHSFEDGVNYNGLVDRFLDPFLHAGMLSILDWGGGTGANTPLRSRASRHDIYDISSISVIAGANAVHRDQIESRSYDLIVCSNVLEHVPYPGDLLLEIKSAMKQSSLLYVEVPYEDLMVEFGSLALARKKHWHEHVNFFSVSAISALICNTGLEVLAMDTNAQITAGLKTSRIMQLVCRIPKLA